MDRSYDLCQLFYKLSSSFNNPGSVGDQLIIPNVQSVCQLRKLPDILQKFVPLINYLVVVIQIMKIRGVQLTQFHIHETAPLGRPVLDDAEVFR